MDLGSLAALIVAVGGAITGLIAWRKTKAEAESIAVTTSIELVNALRKEMDLMRAELDDQRKRRQELADELHSLQRNYTSQLSILRKRVDDLEQWIKLNTAVDPKTI